MVVFKLLAVLVLLAALVLVWYGAAASCGTVATTTSTNNYTITRCASQTPAGTTSGFGGFWNSDLLVSSSRLVSKSPCTTGSQFIVGQQVYVQYGTNRSEDWFPAAIKRIQLCIYQDLDESDTAASKERRFLIAFATIDS
jgi:hypothetical protein